MKPLNTGLNKAGKAAGESLDAEYAAEAKARWGDTDAYKQSQAKVAKMTRAQMDKFKEDGKEFVKRLAASMQLDPSSTEVQSLVDEHHEGIEFFYTCPAPMYRALGRMYVEDPRFTAYYDAAKPGLAAWLNKAISHWCDTKE